MSFPLLRLRLAMCALLVAHAFASGSVRAEEVLVAVASNFAPVAERLAARFEAGSSHDVQIVAGSTGKLYAQIVRGAPFDLFLAADAARPARLVDEGLAAPGSRRVYALGRLVLWTAKPTSDPALGPDTLRHARFRRLALANPDLAPYGVAARELLQSLGRADALAPKLVFGENVGQAFALVASGNAEVGLVAAAQLIGRDEPDTSTWLVPATHHAPIRQELVLLSRSRENAGARAFHAFLSSPEAIAEIRSSGYGVE